MGTKTTPADTPAETVDLPAVAAELTNVSAVPLSLQEFCKRLSTTEPRVELISGFEADERIAGRLKDTEQEFAKRYQAFINRPA